MSCVSGSISNGYSLSSVNLFNVNETITYTCNTFYTLSGNAAATCLDVNGTWSARPSCKLVFYDNVSISNGYVLSSLNLFNVNQTVTYYCNTFYELSGNPVSTCLDTFGNWTSIPTCEFAVVKNVWFWMTVGLASLLALVLLLILLILLIRYCCCHRRRSSVSEFSDSEDRYGDTCGPCCGLVDRKGCCSLYGCCGFFGCMGGFCGCCRCCREFPNDHNLNRHGNSNDANRHRNSNDAKRPPKKKVTARQTQTSPVPTESTVIIEKKEKIAKMKPVYIISNNVESSKAAPTSTKPPKKINASDKHQFSPRDVSKASEEKKKIAKKNDVYIISNNVESSKTAPISTKPSKKVHASDTQQFSPSDVSMVLEEKEKIEKKNDVYIMSDNVESSQTAPITEKPFKKVNSSDTHPFSPSDDIMVPEEKKETVKMNGVYIISDNVESSQTAPISTTPSKKVYSSDTHPFSPSDNSMTSEEKKRRKKAAKMVTMWLPHSHGVRPINTSTK